MEREADVIIVGAGLSGLYAARERKKAGLEPLILEANNRTGGRILTETPVPGIPLELGAQWIGDTHRRIVALAEELGVDTSWQYDHGETT
jgi:monoamine oxidase